MNSVFLVTFPCSTAEAVRAAARAQRGLQQRQSQRRRNWLTRVARGKHTSASQHVGMTLGTRRHKFECGRRGSARTFSDIALCVPRAPPSIDVEEDAAPIGRDRVGISVPGPDPEPRCHIGTWPARRGRRSWPRCGWIPVLSAAGEVPETAHPGHGMANAHALPKGAGGCRLMRCIRPDFHDAIGKERRPNGCCYAARRAPSSLTSHASTGGGEGALAMTSSVGKVSEDGQSTWACQASEAQSMIRSVHPSGNRAALRHTRRHWPLPSGSNAGYQVTSWNMGLGRFY